MMLSPGADAFQIGSDEDLPGAASDSRVETTCHTLLANAWLPEEFGILHARLYNGRKKWPVMAVRFSARVGKPKQSPNSAAEAKTGAGHPARFVLSGPPSRDSTIASACIRIWPISLSSLEFFERRSSDS
jgi:hypothetical protein